MRSAIENQFLLLFQPKTLCNLSDRPQVLRGVGWSYLAQCIPGDDDSEPPRRPRSGSFRHNTQGGTLSFRTELLVLLSVYSGSDSKGLFFVKLTPSYTGKGCQSKICQAKEI